jgi:hypothetical protein
MSSLIMGRQRRGKNELSTLVDPATIVGPEQIYPLGYEVYVSAGTNPGDGSQTWVYVKNTMASDIAAYLPVSGNPTPDPIAPFEVATVNAPYPIYIGYTQAVIPSGEFGFILRRGKGKVTMEGTGTGGINANRGMLCYIGGIWAIQNIMAVSTDVGVLWLLEDVTAPVADFQVEAMLNLQG